MNLSILLPYLPGFLILLALVVGVGKLFARPARAQREDWFESRCEVLQKHYPVDGER